MVRLLFQVSGDCLRNRGGERCLEILDKRVVKFIEHARKAWWKASGSGEDIFPRAAAFRHGLDVRDRSTKDPVAVAVPPIPDSNNDA